MKALAGNYRVLRVMDAVAAGTSDQNGTGVDMAADGGYDGVIFIAALGALTASQVTQMHAEVSSDDGSSDAYTDLADTQTTAMADDDDDQLIVLEVHQPPERYVRPVLERGTANAVIDSIIAIQYSGKSRPATHDATTVQAAALASSKIEGTA